MTEKDMEQLLQELLEECEGNEKFIAMVDKRKDWDKDAASGLVITAQDGSMFVVTIEKL